MPQRLYLIVSQSNASWHYIGGHFSSAEAAQISEIKYSSQCFKARLEKHSCFELQPISSHLIL